VRSCRDVRPEPLQEGAECEEGVDHRFLAGPFAMHPVEAVTPSIRSSHGVPANGQQLRGANGERESYLVRRGLGWCTRGSSARLNRFAFRSKS
jgi:hypothetical protein